MPRWFRKLRADLFGYFWLPCPICHEHFGGFETGGTLNDPGHDGQEGTGRIICRKPSCAEEAERRNFITRAATLKDPHYLVLRNKRTGERRGVVIGPGQVMSMTLPPGT